jgi:hypothetical protein
MSEERALEALAPGNHLAELPTSGTEPKTPMVGRGQRPQARTNLKHSGLRETARVGP